jgi:hypothetical protein
MRSGEHQIIHRTNRSGRLVNRWKVVAFFEQHYALTVRATEREEGRFQEEAPHRIMAFGII